MTQIEHCILKAKNLTGDGQTLSNKRILLRFFRVQGDYPDVCEVFNLELPIARGTATSYDTSAKCQRVSAQQT